MGFHVIIDIIGSMVIGGILLMTLLNIKTTNTENTYKYAGNKILQEYLITLTEMLDNDLKQIGYARDSTYKNPIRIAEANKIKFYTNIKPNAINGPDNLKDELEYHFTGADNNTPNPNDIILKRTVTTADPNFNQGAAVTNLNFGLVNFKLRYFDINGNELTSITTQLQKNSIYSILLDIKMQRTYMYTRDGYSSQDSYKYSKETVRWQRVFYPFKTRNNR